jgi:hypothetical protein
MGSTDADAGSRIMRVAWREQSAAVQEAHVRCEWMCLPSIDERTGAP